MTQVSNQLFRAQDKPFGFDLVSLNIQRGRDHGLPTYAETAEACGLAKPKSFDDLIPFMGRIVSDDMYIYERAITAIDAECMYGIQV